MLTAIDTFFEFFSKNMQTVNSNRKVVGVMDAMDWPPKQVVMEAFYLLVLGQKPIIGKSFWSPAVTTLAHTLQWTWMIQGADLAQGKIGRNRGDRYRTNMQMREEVLKAAYPWYCPKQKWSVQGNTPSGVALVGQLTNPLECIWWQTPTFLNRIDRETGLVYGTATMQVVDMTESLQAA